MLCPYCQTDNRDDMEKCYHCDRDLSMLRVIVNKAKHHYNQGLESAERGRTDEAITEMRNAIELDSTLVNARVVLGTLYAKQEKFDEARREWEAAMAADHRYAKAHEYLAKAQTVERQLPSMKRLKKIMQWMAAALGLVLILTIAFAIDGLQMRRRFRGGPPRDRPQGAMPGTAQQTANGSDSGSRGPGGFREDLDALRAENATLKAQLAALENERLDAAMAAAAGGAPRVALELAAKLQGDRARQIEQQAREGVAASLRSQADAFFAGNFDGDAFLGEADKSIKLLGDAPQADEVKKLRERVAAAQGEKLLAAANGAIAAAPLADAVKAATDLKARRPDLAEAVGMTLDLRLDAEGKKMAEETENLAREGDYAGALAKVDELALAYHAAGRTAGEQGLEDLRKSVTEKQSAAALEEAQQAFDARDWEKFLSLADAIKADSLPEDARAGFEKQRAQAETRMAAAAWDWFESLDPKFTAESLSADQASRAVAIYRRTLDHLPGNLAYARAAILYYAAIAQIKLAQPAKAAELVAKIDKIEKVPGYMKKPILEFKQRHAKVMGIEVPVEEKTANSESATSATQGQ